MKTFHFIGLQATLDPEIAHPLFNDVVTGGTFTLATIIDREGDFHIDNWKEFNAALRESSCAIFAGVIEHARSGMVAHETKAHD